MSTAEHGVLVENFSDVEASIAATVPAARWQMALDSADKEWRAPGSSLPQEFHSTDAGALILARLSAGVCTAST